MTLSDADRDLVVAELGRDPTPAEEILFENLWSEHCAYRSSRPLLSAFDSEGDQVVIGPGDDAAVVALDDDTYITLGIESHNHPSYVDPYDGAATGVGGIVRDTLSMGAYPIALADCLYFGDFDREHSRYLLDGVVEGIADYGNAIGVPTVTGSTSFHENYEGNPLVNVACVGLLSADRLVTAEAQKAGNKLVLVGSSTGRDGLGGASFASEDLAEDAETEDRPAVQVGDPYTEKLLIECNEALIDEDLVESARDLGAAGLGGASSELVAKGGFGAEIDLEKVHQREPNMNAFEILLSESQERMCYEVTPENVERVQELAARFDLGSAVIGEVAEGNYVCTFDGEPVVDVPPEFLAEGAPMNDLDSVEPEAAARDLPAFDLEDAFEAVVSDPNTASKRWVYRQYDHEVGLRTARRPGDDAALLDVPEADTKLAFTGGADPNWTTAAPYDGARAVAFENATNLAAKGASPLATVDCLNGGNPEKPDVYGGFKGIVDGLADMCRALSVPVVGGNVSLYNDSVSGPIPPTPTLAMVGKADGSSPGLSLSGEGDLFLVGHSGGALGGSAVLDHLGGSDAFPTLPEDADAATAVETIRTVAADESTVAVHDASHGGLAVALAEMVTDEVGADVSVSDYVSLFEETPGRVVVETTDEAALRDLAGDVPVVELGTTTDDATLSLTVDSDGDEVAYGAADIAALRDVLARELD
ncbi:MULTISPECIES: phosphoribosylformylglycinamidine synthase subunit PurL [unclassified Haloferax]|uniref:phosphoribosylformylglycinamidine synthase subunit PurL n=1 Tax=unclassified Haloferax TaxID=2625095 RepID=UPI000E24114C|nr:MULTISPECIES: phosphoribosylformylglycinamidine synthase subunit PurL [unclassified Haloferax]RDZ37508.1 phosphoribosylformylglycinamidine synthase subunit PurL [Haloferax sp. Atlit-24N]RLM38304.1 phosphoribosylformylglycinamidine synthase subunit PurL [Haloferax sp. Atlit-109R]RLM46247.1 phosphoribosylformylglycinamidine synthase subunit PurL [Haloferax sp. Atlit-105R]